MVKDSTAKTEEFINAFKKFSGKELQNEIDVFKLIDSVIQGRKDQLLEDLAFSSKYCVGLYNILGQNKTELSEEYTKEITQSFAETIEQIKTKLNEIISDFSEFERESFKARYFEMSQTGINNLFSLINDFSEIKIFLNEQKRSRS